MPFNFILAHRYFTRFRFINMDFSNLLPLPKAFQTNTVCLFCFFAPCNGTAVLASLKTSSQSIGLTQSLSNKHYVFVLLFCSLQRDCRSRFAQTSSSAVALPKARDCQCFALSALAIGSTQSPGLPMLRIVCPCHWINPKPFKQTLRVCFAFFIFVSLHKRACDAALNEKSLSFA